MRRAIVLVLDSFGIGSAPDADKFGDQGADTLGHIAAACARGEADTAERSGPLKLPNMAALGLFHAHRDATGSVAEGVSLPEQLNGAYAHAKEISSGKDTPSGHWEIAGVPVRFDWGYFLDKTNSFPQALLDSIVQEADLPGVIGNCHASGTEIIACLGEEHIATGKPIVYTSADSVFQIAAHEEHFGLERLYALCETVRELLEPYNIGRVIARPFIGDDRESFARTGNRRDYSVEPPSPTVLQKLAEAGGEVVSIGKIADIYAHCGITHKVKASGHDALMEATLAEVARTANETSDRPTMIMTNFVDFDSVYGHRRDVGGKESTAGTCRATPLRWSTSMPACRSCSPRSTTTTCCCSPPTTAATLAGKAPSTPANTCRSWCAAQASPPARWASAAPLPTLAKPWRISLP
jgi:phosphopentomutase